MKKNNSTKKKTTKKKSKMKKKKKKLLKSTENAIKKKMAPTKKNHKTAPDDLDGTLSDISLGDGVESASDHVDGLSNGSDLSENDLDNSAIGKKES